MARPHVSVHVEGLSELLAAFRKLPDDLTSRELQRATNAGIDPILVVARGNAARVGEGMATHQSTGLLVRSVVRTAGRKWPNNRASFVAIKRLSKSKIRAFKQATGMHSRQNPYDPFYWKFWEFGTSKLPARRFIRNAWDVQKGRALDATREELARGLVRATRRVHGRKGLARR